MNQVWNSRNCDGYLHLTATNIFVHSAWTLTITFPSSSHSHIILIMSQMPLKDQPQSFNFLPVLFPGRHDIDPCRIDAAVSQNIGKLCDIPLDAVKCPGKKLSEIVRKHFCPFYIRLFAEPFHVSPHKAPVKRLSPSVYKNYALRDMGFPGIM